MKKWISRTGIFYVAGLTLLFVITGCSKSAVETVQTTYLQQQFEDNILNKNFRVHLATDNGVDLTPQYTGYTFVLYKSTYYNGPMTAVKNGIPTMAPGAVMMITVNLSLHSHQPLLNLFFEPGVEVYQKIPSHYGAGTLGYLRAQGIAYGKVLSPFQFIDQVNILLHCFL
ncbi:MAG: hypothetical protein IPL50_13785 [Chitinophagaceae bacterium]|nr:hypothetical protein [Chitinophagaceae bacterium]